MHKYLVTLKSQNPITGPILVTTSPRISCPASCKLKGTACYAEKGFLGGFIWRSLDMGEPEGRFANNILVYSLDQLLSAIRSLPPGSVWRHNQAGDLMWENGDRTTISAATLDLIIRANRGRRGFTFTHYDVLDNFENRRLVAEANKAGLRINLSADDLGHADRLCDVGIGPVAVLAALFTNHVTPKGRKIVICPARTHPGVTCSSCRLCTRMRDFIVGLPDLNRFPLVSNEESIV